MCRSLMRRHLLRLGLLGLGSPMIVRAAPAADAPNDALHRLLAERLRLEGVGLAAARLRHSGGLELAAATRPGTAALDPRRHRFEIGSITKVFVGVLLADAVQRGELKLDDAVETLLGFPLRDSEGQPLRFVDIATHRSGLPRLPPNLQPALEADPYVDYGEAALLDALRSHRATRRRDERFEYSNYGFGLLGWLLARRARQSLNALLRQRVLAPLGIAHGASLPDVQGHDAHGRPVPAWNFTEATAGAGALRLSAAELARFAQAALDPTPHPLREAFALSLQPHGPLGPQPGLQMGLGWMLATQDGRRIATHDGGTFGFSSSLWLDLDRRQGGLVLANAFVTVTDLARHLMDERAPLRDIATEQRSTAQPAQPVAADTLAPLVGVYAASPQFKLTLRLRDGRLFAQATGQGEFELFAKGPRRFFARVTALEVEFAGEAGTPARLVIHQGGHETPFEREGDEAATVALAPEKLRPLVGVYALNAGFKLALRADGARLFAQATGQGEFELFAEGSASDARNFVARVTPLTIRFEDGDPAPALRLLQAGRELRFVREP